MNKLLNYKEYLMENEEYDLDEEDNYDDDDYTYELEETKYGNPITGALKIDHHIINFKRQKAKAGNIMLSPAKRALARRKMQHHKNRIRQMMDEGFYHDDYDDVIGEGVYTALAGEHHLKNYRIAKHIANNPHKSESARARARARMEKHAGYISRMVGEKV